jgi:uncharacterized protein DUF6158
MREITALLDDVYAGQERISQSELHRRAMAAGASTRALDALTSLPEGEYARDEVIESLAQLAQPAGDEAGELFDVDGLGTGVPAGQLADDDLLRELAAVHRTRHDTLRHGSDQALAHHDERTAELEGEYLRRFPGREVSPARLTAGARDRAARTGADQPWDPEDLARAEGRDPTPANVERARRELADEGAAAIERTVP